MTIRDRDHTSRSQRAAHTHDRTKAECVSSGLSVIIEIPNKTNERVMTWACNSVKTGLYSSIIFYE